MAVARQVNDLEQERETLQKSSLTDGLTGAWNRKMFDQMIAEAFANVHGNPEARSLSVIFMDGDRFKSVNHTYGHKAGDKVIQILAQRMTQAVGGTRLARMPDTEAKEFVAILENIDAKHAHPDRRVHQNQHLQSAIRPHQCSSNPRNPDHREIGVSVRQPREDSTTPDLLVHEADQGVMHSNETAETASRSTHPRS